MGDNIRESDREDKNNNKKNYRFDTLRVHLGRETPDSAMDAGKVPAGYHK